MGKNSRIDFMDETYRCICGEKQFTIQDCTITCVSCARIYDLIFLKKRGIESPANFNSRIRS